MLVYGASERSRVNMPCVHYKFFSKLTHDTVIFDGLHITLADLKRQIMSREKLKCCELRITNDQTNEEYSDNADIIPSYTMVSVRRIPGTGVKSTYNRRGSNWSEPSSGSSRAQMNGCSLSLEQLFKTENLAEANASEEDKIKAVMFQSSRCYYTVNEALKLVGGLPPNYVCFNCGIPGHHIRNCPKSRDPTFVGGKRIRRSAGIPVSFLVEVDDPNMKGVMLSSSGKHVIPIINAEAYASQKKENPPFFPQNESSSSTSGEDAVPDDFLCRICKDLITDAVMTPCCSNSYCDDCIRTCLLDSDEHVCPTCKQSNVSPDALNINMFLRQELNRFKNSVAGSVFSHHRKPLKSQSACSSTSPSISHRSSSPASGPNSSRTNIPSGKRGRELSENDDEDNGSRPLKKTKHAAV
ncbi:E3 ubiquitin-protein ligase RBBP6-like isoform X1 [Triplophysa dalaica]|uniref:E3 ubiquitin-protein ligase RBBP6-like isoform X1 n=2 Tax=Triplophysa dalaica TaxID=1582913 RepID=UPI0024DFA035|nr:E3 ubiquitin-protein ligase RBBP6-like isoform X1 [Triplophysa dalaica]